jgi:hypothetical protein
MLAAICLGIGFGAPYLLKAIVPAAQVIIPGCDIGSVYSIPQQYLFVTTVSLILLVYVAVLASKNAKVKTYSVWECGYGELPPRGIIGAESYAHSIAVLFRPILQYRMHGVIRGTDRRHFPELIRVSEKSVPLLTYKIYRPILALFYASSKLLIKLQTANIHVHLLYVIATLLILIVIGTRVW